MGVSTMPTLFLLRGCKHTGLEGQVDDKMIIGAHPPRSGETLPLVAMLGWGPGYRECRHVYFV